MGQVSFVAAWNMRSTPSRSSWLLRKRTPLTALASILSLSSGRWTPTPASFPISKSAAALSLPIPKSPKQRPGSILLPAAPSACTSRAANTTSVLKFATCIFRTLDLQADGAAGSKIDPGRCFGDFGIGKESAAADFEIGNDAGVGVQRPLESERIYANAVSGVRFLSNEEDRDGVDRIFQAAAKKTWPMRFAEDQAVTKTHVPDAVAGLAASDPVAASGPNLHFVAALDRAGLRAN